MAKEDLTQVDILKQIADTLATVKASASPNDALLEKISETLAGVANRQRPENPEHSRVSHYNPKGLKDAERPQLKCAIYWVGYPESIDTLRDDEIEALNLLQPGEYRVTKGNGVTIPFTVEGKRNDAGVLHELWVRFPCTGDQRSDHRSKVEYCKEAMGEKVPTVAELMAQVRELQQYKALVEAV